MSDPRTADHEHKLARALVVAYTEAQAAELLLNALDAVYERARQLEQEIAALPVADQDGHYSVRQAMTILGVSDHHIRKLMAQDKFAYRKSGASVRIPKREFDAYLESITVRGTPQEPKKRKPRKLTASEANMVERYPWVTASATARPRAS